MTASPQIKFDDKESFIAALEARRPFLHQLDKARSAAHKVAEKEYLEQFREECKAAAKWTYQEAQKHDFNLPNAYQMKRSAPSCPIAQVPRLEEVLKTLRLTSQKQFTVDRDNIWASAHYILTFDPEIEAAKKVC